MPRRLLALFAITATLAVAACSGTATTTAPSQAPAGSASAAASADGATGACAPSTEAGTVAATMSGRAFVPGMVSAKVGDVVTWTNDDTLTHTATLTDDPACTTPNLRAGESGGLTFSAPGTYPFFCKVHSDMTGTIEVTS